MTDTRTLKAVYVGKAGDWKPTYSTADRIEHIQHFVDRSAPLTADDTTWLLQTARDAIKECDELRALAQELHGHLSGIITPRKEER